MGIQNIETEMPYVSPQSKRKAGNTRRIVILISLLVLTALLGTTAGVIAFNQRGMSALNSGNSSMNSNSSNNKMLAGSITAPHKQPQIITFTATPTPKTTGKPHVTVPLIYYGSTYIPEVALSFDDGPSPIYTRQILAILKQYQVPATFFCIGRQVQQYPDIVRMEFDQPGIVVGNHSWSHPDLPLLTQQQITLQLQQTSTILEQTTGQRPTFFRPPYGAINRSVLSIAKSLKLTAVLWNDDPRDWSLPGVKTIIKIAVGTAGNGSIILMHDGGGNRSETIAALPTIIQELRSNGYRIVPLQQMIDDLNSMPPDKKHPKTGGPDKNATLTPDDYHKPPHSGGPGK